MELKLTRIWSLNHYSNPGATAGQMPKGRLVPRHWGGLRHSIDFGDQATAVTNREAAVRPLQRDLSRSRVTSSTSHCPLTQALVGAGAAGGHRATPWPCSSTLDRGWSSRAEGWQKILSPQGHQDPGGMTLLLGRSCTSSRGEKHKGKEKSVWFMSLGLEINPPSWRGWSILWRGLCLSHELGR